jgi:hypothetical protein
MLYTPELRSQIDGVRELVCMVPKPQFKVMGVKAAAV